MIDIRKLKELVRLMVNNELTELDLRDSEEQVTLRRGAGNAVALVPPAAAAPIAAAVHAAPPAVSATGAGPAGSSTPPAEDDGLVKIVSPMVGTYYAAATPDADPFVSVGSTVMPDTVVCMMEAMKIFNEIKAEISGTVEKVMVRNGEPVEFGQTLFMVRSN